MDEESSRGHGRSTDTPTAEIGSGMSRDRPSNSFALLDEHVRPRWQLGRLISSGIFFIFLTVGGALLWGLTAVPAGLIAIVWLAVGILMLVQSLLWPGRQYAHWSYRLTERVLELRFGVIWQVSVLIPVSRLQHVDLRRDPLDRLYGLATLVVHTAGTRSPSHEIPGLLEQRAHELRDDLIQLANLEPEGAERSGE